METIPEYEELLSQILLIDIAHATTAFPERLKELREDYEKKGLLNDPKMKYFAERFRAYEEPNGFPPFPWVCVISAFYDCTIDYLLGY